MERIERLEIRKGQKKASDHDGPACPPFDGDVDGQIDEKEEDVVPGNERNMLLHRLVLEMEGLVCSEEGMVLQGMKFVGEEEDRSLVHDKTMQAPFEERTVGDRGHEGDRIPEKIPPNRMVETEAWDHLSPIL